MNQHPLHSQSAHAAPSRKSRVAIIGSGLAGLTTAYLVNHDDLKRYEVTLFEQVRSAALEMFPVWCVSDQNIEVMSANKVWL